MEVSDAAAGPEPVPLPGGEPGDDGACVDGASGDDGGMIGPATTGGGAVLCAGVR